MKKVLLIVCLSAFGLEMNAQEVVKKSTVTVDADGNYRAKTTEKAAAKPDKKTGKTYTHSNGKEFDVYIGSKAGLYVWRTRQRGKNIGKKYKFYFNH